MSPRIVGELNGQHVKLAKLAPRHGLIALAVVALLAIPAPSGGSGDINWWLERVASCAESPEGRPFVPEVTAHFESGFRDAVSACLAEAPAGQVRVFRIVLRLEASGEVDDILVDPDTTATACMREILKNKTFPAPPFAPFYAMVEATR